MLIRNGEVRVGEKRYKPEVTPSLQGAPSLLGGLLKPRMHFWCNENWYWDIVTPIFLSLCTDRELKITMVIWISRWRVLIKG